MYPIQISSAKCHHPQLFFIGSFSSFPRCSRVRLLVWIAAYTQTTFLSDNIFAIYPPWKPDSGIILCSDENADDVEQYCIGTAPLPPLISAGGPPVKNWTGLIIRRHHADKTRRRERPRDHALLGSLLTLQVFCQAIILFL